MKFRTESIISDLVDRTKQNIIQVEKLDQRTEQELNRKKTEESWSVLECLEHLNLYGEFYIPEIRQQIERSKAGPEIYFRSGLLGNYFAKSMLPPEGMKKMKTFRDKNPIGSNLNRKTITRFLEQQEEILELLNQTKTVSLSKTKTSISISRLVKLKLGDTLRVLIYHNQRHILQARKVLE